MNQTLCQVPDLVVLPGVVNDGADQSDAEKGSVCVVIKCRGLLVVVVGRVNVGGGQELLQCRANDADGVQGRCIWNKVETCSARLHYPFVEAVVYIVTLRQDVLRGGFAPFGEDGSSDSCCKHLCALSVGCKKWYAACAIWVKEVFFGCGGAC